MATESQVATAHPHDETSPGGGRSALAGWIIDVAAGCLVGAVIGSIAAVNIVIIGGISDGYETDFAQVFDDSLLVGILAVGVLVTSPVVGVLVACRARRGGRTSSSGRSDSVG